MSGTTKVEVTFHIEVPTSLIESIHEEISKLKPGSVAYSDKFDEIKVIQKHCMTRLDGECQAYMNIAKEKIISICEFDPTSPR